MGSASAEQATALYTVADVVASLLLSFALGAAVALVYKRTHTGQSYAQTLAQTLVVIGMLVTTVVLLIGSSGAGGLVLLGAMSVVRYRTALKEPRDVAFIFMMAAVGMAVGAKCYLQATLAAAIICLAIVVMSRRHWFEGECSVHLLRVEVPSQLPFDGLLQGCVAPYVRRAALIRVESIRGGNLTALTYRLVMDASSRPDMLLAEIREGSGGCSVGLTSDYGATDQ